ncbi:MAG: WD40/YVTN/BNR-like repeat-containing protein [Alphaproteobacteria bacterium]
MKIKSRFWLFLGALSLIYAGEINGQSQAAAGQGGQQLDAPGKSNPAVFDHVNALAMNLAGKEMFLGTDAGLYRSVDGGRAWKRVPIPARQSSLAVMAVAPDQKKAGTIYIATREAGVLMSADGGTNWNPINNGLGGVEVHGLALDPNDSKLYAVIRSKVPGIYRSADSGGKWSRVNGGPGKEITFLSSVNIPTGMGGIFLYAGTVEGLQRSPDCF